MSPWLRKRDGSIAYAAWNPDGSWIEIPVSEEQSISGREPLQGTPSLVTGAMVAENIRQFLRDIGRRGGQARAARHTRREIAEWGSIRHNKG